MKFFLGLSIEQQGGLQQPNVRYPLLFSTMGNSKGMSRISDLLRLALKSDPSFGTKPENICIKK